MLKFMFVYHYYKSNETKRKDLDAISDLENFYDPDNMYPICMVDKVVHPGGSYTVLNERYF